MISRAKCTSICPSELCGTGRQLDQQLEVVHRVGRRHLTTEEKEAIGAIDIARATPEERFTYWFPAAYRANLEGILQQILTHSEGTICTFFLCGFSNILKRCSIWLIG